MFHVLRGNTHMTSTLRGGWEGVRQKWDVIGCKEVEGWRVFLTSNLYFFLLKKIGFAPWPDIMLSQTLILLTKNLLFDTDARQWSHPLMIPLHVCGINRTVEPVVNLNMTWLAFVFVLISFVHMHSAVVIP